MESMRAVDHVGHSCHTPVTQRTCTVICGTTILRCSGRASLRSPRWWTPSWTRTCQLSLSTAVLEFSCLLFSLSLFVDPVPPAHLFFHTYTYLVHQGIQLRRWIQLNWMQLSWMACPRSWSDVTECSSILPIYHINIGAAPPIIDVKNLPVASFGFYHRLEGKVLMENVDAVVMILHIRRFLWCRVLTMVPAN